MMAMTSVLSNVKLNPKGKIFLVFIAALVIFWVLRRNFGETAVFGDETREPIFRRTLNRIHKSPDEFCYVSYNILADQAIIKYPKAYLHLPVAVKIKGPNFKTSLRHKQMMKELLWLRPDVISLQEAEELYFLTLVEEFGASGFKGVFKPHHKGVNKGHGLATFYNTKRFKMEKTLSFGFNELLGKWYDLSKFKNSTKRNERIALFMLLSELKTGKLLGIGNVHIMWKMQEADVQALQISIFFQQLYKITSNGTIPWVMSGDFNMYPYFPTYDLILNGKVSEEGLKKLNPHKYKYPEMIERDVVENKESYVLKNCRKHLSHPLKNVKSAYKTVLGNEPPFTHYGAHKGTLDYIWYSSDKLRVNAVLEPVKEKVIKPFRSCPNKVFPSDHLSIKAYFSFKTKNFDSP